MFGRLKDWHRVVTPYDRSAKTFLSAVGLAATVTFWLLRPMSLDPQLVKHLRTPYQIELRKLRLSFPRSAQKKRLPNIWNLRLWKLHL